MSNTITVKFSDQLYIRSNTITVKFSDQLYIRTTYYFIPNIKFH